MITYAFSDKRDLESIVGLLKKYDLPYSDIGFAKSNCAPAEVSPVTFIHAKKDNQVVGCIGVEKYGTEGLLRSFAVDVSIRKNGYGRELYRRLLEYSVQSRIKNLHLLTNTARDYFLRAGFSVQNRIDAPEIIQNSAEFKSLCPSSSIYMVLKDISKQVY